MKEFVKATYRQNADAIICGAKSFDFFNKGDVQLGDVVRFVVYEDGSVVKHQIDRNLYKITVVDDAPQIVKDVVVAGFKRRR